VSNFLAVAAATATLRQIVDDAVRDDVDGATVTTLRPNAPSNLLPSPGVNLYLYQVTPNVAWRNADVPTRRPGGDLVQQPRVAIDLHYLLTFYGDDAALEPQRLLGSAVRSLHEQPVLARRKIRSVIDAAIAGDPQHYLATADLDADVELVKFTPLSLNLEELSKLWSVFFQTAYSLSIAYQGTVVLIESSRAAKPSLPVREPGIYVVPLGQPRIHEVASDAPPNGDPRITLADTLVVRGVALKRQPTRLRISAVLVQPAASDVTDTAIRLPLAPVTALRAGVQTVQVVHDVLMGQPAPGAPHRGVESNVAAFVLHPIIAAPVVSNGAATEVDGQPLVIDGVQQRSATVTVGLTPAVGRAQRASLHLYEANAPDNRPPRAYSFSAPANNGLLDPDQADTPSIDFAVRAVFPGVYLVRVQVDGAESLLARDAAGRYTSPAVTI
jgi:hypothetical protein